MSTQSAEHPTSTERPKFSTGAILVRLILFVVLLGLPFAAAGRLDWPQGLVYLAVMLVFVGGSRIVMARKYPDLVTERLRAGDLPDSKQWDKPLSAIIGL